jgi:FdhD protein
MKPGALVTPVHTIDGANSSEALDALAIEEPLEIRVNGQTLAITLRTPGHDADLATGLLLSEGLMRDPASITAIREHEGRVEIELPDVPGVTTRNLLMNSACGFCGKLSLDDLAEFPRPPLADSEPECPAGMIRELPAQLRAAQPVFDRTGGLHAAGLFSAAGELIAIREDIGRHNALDKLIGHALRSGLGPLNRSIVMLSGRIGFELVQKVVVAGIPVVAAVGAPSSLAVSTARRFGITLLGFVRDQRFNIYSGHARIGEAGQRG